MKLTTLLLTALLPILLTAANPLPQKDGEDGDTGDNYVSCLGACNGDSTACLVGARDTNVTVLGVTFLCEAEAFMCQTLCSGTLSFETVVKNWVPAAKAIIQAWQAAHSTVK